MKLHRRYFLYLVGVSMAAGTSRQVSGQDYPVRPVRIIVGAPAGGAADVHARLIGKWLSERLGQQFVIENRSGANGNIANEAVARAVADGYTLLLVTSAVATDPALHDNANFDFVRDIRPVASISRGGYVMVVNRSFPADTVPDLIAYAKANPGKINFGSPGNGSTPHLCGELFKIMAGVSMTHVPYRGGVPALTDLLGGQIQLYFGGPAAVEYSKAGRVRALAVTGAVRLQALPDLPLLSDFLPGFEVSDWIGLGAPKGTSSEVIERLNEAVNAGLATAEVKARLVDFGVSALAGTSDDFDRLIAEEIKKWTKVVRLAGIKTQ